MKTQSRREYDAVLRQDFNAFIEKCYYQLNPRGLFLPNWHLEAMAAKLEACRRGDIRRLIINVPPRHLKSIAASVALVAWWLGHDPTAQILCASYGQDLADKHALDCRAVMQSPWCQRLFKTRLSEEKQAVNDFETMAKGFRIATSIGGVLTGRGADVVIIDDPLKPDEAISDVRRRAANEWYDNTLFSRLNNKQTGCIIILMQRLHEDDLVGHVLGQESWEVIEFPAIAVVDEVHVIKTAYSSYTHLRKAGEALHPERESLETLERIRQTLGEYNFTGQYQQCPAPLGGGMIKRAWFPTYEPHQLPDNFDQIVQSWDTANKATELSNFSVCTTWGLKGNKIYLLHVLRKRLDYPELKRAVREQAQLHKAKVILIEDKASGTPLIQELNQEGPHNITAYKPEGDKIMRMHAQTATLENGRVFIPKEAAWLEEYLHELVSFPKGKYSDQVDSTSQVLDWIKQNSWEPGILTYYKQECIRLGLAYPDGTLKNRHLSP